MFRINEAIEILERTPDVLERLLTGLSDTWIVQNEGEGTWSPYDVVGHLVHGEKTDWINRAKTIMEEIREPFAPFDREAQFQDSNGKSIEELLNEFYTLRTGNLEILKGMDITEEDLNKRGIHPAFGEVTLKQLLSTWAVHDLGHIAQITRVMAKQYNEEVGPWEEYLRIIK